MINLLVKVLKINFKKKKTLQLHFNLLSLTHGGYQVQGLRLLKCMQFQV
jgi:hypothetical protein